MKDRAALFLIASALVLVTLMSASAFPQPPSVIINIMMYITDGDKNFHRSGCGLLYGKRISSIPLGQAYKEGYTPCEHCKPPQINEP